MAIRVNLITGRSIQQGVSMEAGKARPAYTDAFKKLGAFRNTNVRVTSKYGSVIVKAVEATQGPHPGVAYIPMGPWANMVINPNTYSTGMPTFKGTPVEVEIAKNEPVFSSLELVRKGCRGELA